MVNLDLSDIPVVDIHNHLDPTPRAGDYEDVVFYHYIVTELRTAGMPEDKLLNLRGPMRLREALPYLRYVRNTSTHWALMRILNDIYGLGISEINEGNYELVVKTIEEKHRDTQWAIRVIRDFAKARKLILTLNPLEPPPEYNASLFTGAIRLDPLIPNIGPGSLKALEEASGVEVRGPGDLREAFLRVLNRFRGRVVAVTLNLQPDDDYFLLKPSDAHVVPFIKGLKERIAVTLSTTSAGYSGVVNPDARRFLSAFLLREVLEFARENKLVVQLMLGVKRPVPGADPHDFAVTFFNPTQLLNLTLLFSEYPDVKFDLLIADMLLNHPTTVVAKNYPNVFLNGYWWYSMYPEAISSYLRLRLQMLPYNKVGGFFSDAYVASWVYGKAALAKKVLGDTLSEAIDRGYLSRDLAMELAEAVLHRNAEALYGL